MYRAFYQLTKPVDRKDIPIEELYKPQDFTEAVSRLEFMKDKGGVVVVSGSSGVGKTTLLRYFVETLNTNFYKVVYAPLSTITPRDFYRQIAMLLGAELSFNKTQLFHSIQHTIIQLATEQKKIPIIILDDAHFFKSENFFELQLLSNFNYDSFSPALFILAAQPHLIDRLRKPAFDAFYQRIKMHIPIQPFSLQQTRSFVQHIISTATAKEKHTPVETLFQQQALELLHDLSGGIHRKITKILEKALIYGAANKIELIDQEVIYKISAEI
jgi:type II secretory pathway predicted ATPase ExeA